LVNALPKDGLFLKAPYYHFKEFISAQADRFTLLCSIIDEFYLPKEVLEIEGKRHIAVSPLGGNSKCNLILTAHYDRVPKSPGANDNGAAVFQLLETAIRIAERRDSGRAGKVNPALFIFTDGEELLKGESLNLQGSYSLGLYLKKNGLGKSSIYTFDACGTGNSLIISTAADQLLKNEYSSGAEAARRKVQVLRQKALTAAQEAHLDKVLLLPTPFSEDAGFLLAGMAAQTITVLPQNEAAQVRRDDSFTPPPDKVRRLFPETWRILNGPGDSPLRLTPENWKKVSAFAGALTE
jgi:hypothetical protein